MPSIVHGGLWGCNRGVGRPQNRSPDNIRRVAGTKWPTVQANNKILKKVYINIMTDV